MRTGLFVSTAREATADVRVLLSPLLLFIISNKIRRPCRHRPTRKESLFGIFQEIAEVRASFLRPGSSKQKISLRPQPLR